MRTEFLLSQDLYDKLKHLRVELVDLLHDTELVDLLLTMDSIVIKNPDVEFTERLDNGDFDGMSDAEYAVLKKDVDSNSIIFGNQSVILTSKNYTDFITTLTALYQNVDVLIDAHDKSYVATTLHRLMVNDGAAVADKK